MCIAQAVHWLSRIKSRCIPSPKNVFTLPITASIRINEVHAVHGFGDIFRTRTEERPPFLDES